PPLAASSTDRTTEIARRTLSPRVTFAKLGDPIDVPDLLSLQTTSFDWLLGNERWEERAAEAAAIGNEDVPQTSGLADILEEISPIEDFAGNMALSFRDHTFDDPKYTVDECKEKDLTYAAQMYVIAEVMNDESGEIKTQTVFMGVFHMMTDKGIFIINGTERTFFSQLVSSPGVYFEERRGKSSDRHFSSATIIHSRSARQESEGDKQDQVGLRIARRRKQSVTTLLQALGNCHSDFVEEFGEFASMRSTLEKDRISPQ